MQHESDARPYRAIVAVGTGELAQPLKNVTTIRSDRTQSNSDDSNVLIQPPPTATGTPAPAAMRRGRR